jgi:hypothetical protein
VIKETLVRSSHSGHETKRDSSGASDITFDLPAELNELGDDSMSNFQTLELKIASKEEKTVLVSIFFGN